MIVHQAVHDLVRQRSPVKNIADNMQMVYHKPLYQFCHCYNERLCPPDIQNRLNDGLIIRLFVRKFRLLCNQLFNNVSIIRRQRFPYLGSGILGRNDSAKFDQPVKRHSIPVLHVLPGLS